MKLQLYISLADGNFDRVLGINPSDEVSHALVDLSPALQSLRLEADKAYSLHHLRYLHDGIALTMLHVAPGGACVQATVFIPAGILPDSRLATALQAVEEAISGGVPDPGVQAELRNIFSADWPVTQGHAAIPASHGRTVMVATVTPAAMQALASQGYFQPALVSYAGVLLVDSDSGIEVVHDNLGSLKVVPTVKALPPSATADGFMPHIYGYTFTRPFMVESGGEVVIQWERPGFEHVTQTFTAPDHDFTPAQPDTSHSRKGISPATFIVNSQMTRQPIEEVHIRINDQPLDTQRFYTLSEMTSMRVEITSPGYFPYNGILDLSSITQAVVQLREMRKIYRFELPVSSSELGAPVKFDIFTNHVLTESPIEGYTLTDKIREGAGRTNTLIYKGAARSSSLLAHILPAVGGLLVGALVAWLLMLPSHGSAPQPEPIPADTMVIATPDTVVAEPDSVDIDTAMSLEIITESCLPDSATVAMQEETSAAPEAKTPEKAAESAAVAPKPAAHTKSQLIAYLDSQRRWQADSLEQYPDARDLFDDINNYRFDRLSTYWGEQLKDSRNMRRVAKAAQQAKAKRNNPRRGIHAPTYCRKGDIVVNWEGYCNWIDP